MNRRVTRRAALGAGLSAAAGLTSCSRKEEDGGGGGGGFFDPWWVGKTVLPKKPDPAGKFVPPRELKAPANPDGTATQLTRSLPGASWEVKAEKDKAVQVLDTDGTACWVEKDLLVPLADAVGFYTLAVKVNDKDAWSYNFRGWAHYLLGNSKDAVADFDAVLELSPVGPDPVARARHVVGLSNRGLVLAEAGKFDAAIRDLAAASVAGSSEATLNCGWAYELQSHYGHADEAYRGLTGFAAETPMYVPALNNMAWMKATCPEKLWRDGATAVKLAQTACKRTADREGAYLDTLAAAHAEAGAFAEAVRAQEKALEDVGFAKRHGESAQKRLQLYKDKKPFRSEPLK